MGVAVGGSIVAILDNFILAEPEEEANALIQSLRFQLGSDPEFLVFAESARDVLYTGGADWPTNIDDARTINGWSIDEVIAKVEEDFSQGRTVTVLGWILSRTEAALVTLV